MISSEKVGDSASNSADDRLKILVLSVTAFGEPTAICCVRLVWRKVTVPVPVITPGLITGNWISSASSSKSPPPCKSNALSAPKTISVAPLMVNLPPLSKVTAPKNETFPVALMVRSPSTVTASLKLTLTAWAMVRPFRFSAALVEKSGSGPVPTATLKVTSPAAAFRVK